MLWAPEAEEQERNLSWVWEQRRLMQEDIAEKGIPEISSEQQAGRREGRREGDPRMREGPTGMHWEASVYIGFHRLKQVKNCINITTDNY